MKTEIEALLTAIETINAITPETPTINGFPIIYRIKNLFIDEHNDDDHNMYVIKLENRAHSLLNSTDSDDDDSIYYDQDEKLGNQIMKLDPNVLLPNYGPWKLIEQGNTPYSIPTIYVTSSHDSFTINITDYHIIITVILSGMY